MEEQLWNLEDKWKLTTQKAVAIFACSSILVIGFCIAGVLKKRRTKGILHEEPCKDKAIATESAEPLIQTGWRLVRVKEVLVGSERWSEARKWDDGLWGASGREIPTPLVVRREDVGWQSHNSTSAVWQRPILMGEKCELPRFSGLILYDHRGRPLHQFEEGIATNKQEEKGEVMETTFEDLLRSSPASTTVRVLRG